MAKNILIKDGTEILSNIDTIVTRDENNVITEWIPSDYELISLPLDATENRIYLAPKGYGYNRVDVNVLKDMTEEKYLKRELNYISLSSISNIGSYAFYGQSLLQEIYAPNVKKINQYTFYNCSSLESVSFSNSCSIIESNAFYNCKNLSSINLSNCSSIGDYAFYNCSNLSRISLYNCRSIGNFAFYKCTSLAFIRSPSCSYVGNNTFEGCTSLTEAILSSCSSIGNNAFSGCISLTEVNLPECSFIGSSIFTSCYSLKKVNLSKCASIDSNIFSECSHLEEVNLLACSSINRTLFPSKNIKNLKSIYLSTECSEIPAIIFRSCSNLINIYFGSDNEEFQHLPDFTTVRKSAFLNCSNLELQIGNSIYVYDSGFCNCKKIRPYDSNEVYITFAGPHAFDGCSNFICNNLNYDPGSESRYIGGYAFRSCKIKNVKVFNCSEIRNGAFESCTPAEKLYIFTSSRICRGTNNALSNFVSAVSVFSEIYVLSEWYDSYIDTYKSYPSLTGKIYSITISGNH